jgi:hypothetical protein
MILMIKRKSASIEPQVESGAQCIFQQWFATLMVLPMRPEKSRLRVTAGVAS